MAPPDAWPLGGFSRFDQAPGLQAGQPSMLLGYPVFTSDKVLRATYEWPYDYNELHHITAKQIPDSYKPHHIKCYYSRTKFTIPQSVTQFTVPGTDSEFSLPSEQTQFTLPRD